jgi:hypothetical protein
MASRRTGRHASPTRASIYRGAGCTFRQARAPLAICNVLRSVTFRPNRFFFRCCALVTHEQDDAPAGRPPIGQSGWPRSASSRATHHPPPSTIPGRAGRQASPARASLYKGGGMRISSSARSTGFPQHPAPRDVPAEPIFFPLLRACDAPAGRCS